MLVADRPSATAEERGTIQRIQETFRVCGNNVSVGGGSEPAGSLYESAVPAGRFSEVPLCVETEVYPD